jgi:hypothetical protein
MRKRDKEMEKKKRYSCADQAKAVLVLFFSR